MHTAPVLGGGVGGGGGGGGEREFDIDRCVCTIFNWVSVTR